MSLENSVTPPGIDPVRVVTQRVNHYAIPGPCIDVILVDNIHGRAIC